MSRADSPPVALSFEVTGTPGGSSAGDSVTITSIERDDLGIRVTYDSIPPVGLGIRGPEPRRRTILVMTTTVLAAISGSPEADGVGG